MIVVFTYEVRSKAVTVTTDTVRPVCSNGCGGVSAAVDRGVCGVWWWRQRLVVPSPVTGRPTAVIYGGTPPGARSVAVRPPDDEWQGRGGDCSGGPCPTDTGMRYAEMPREGT